MTSLQRICCPATKMSITDYVIAAATNKEVVNFEGLAEVVTQIKRLGNDVNQLLILARQDRINYGNRHGSLGYV